MTITTNTLGSNSAEIVIQGPETIANVGAAVQTFLLAHGWYLVPDTNPSTTASAVSASGNIITVTSSASFVVGMPVIFTGTTFGGIANSTIYFILTIPDSTHVTIAATSPIQNSGVTSVALVASATGMLTMSCPTTATTPQGSTLALAGNSTNNKSRVYWTFCLTGQVIKYIRLNFADLSLDTAQYFTAAAAPADSSTGSSQSYRINFVQHFSYPRDYYLNTATTSTAAANPSGSLGAGAWTIGHSSTNTSGTIVTSTSLATPYSVVGLPVYPGQQSVLYSPSSGNYAYRSVSSYVDATGTVSWGAIQFATANGASYSDWVVLWPTMLNYNNSNNPAYVYISATARHVCIQTRNVDGQWNDWTAVTEYENPLAVDNGTTIGTTAWGLTTGMMSANTGVVCRANLGFGFESTGNGTASSITPFSNQTLASSTGVSGSLLVTYSTTSGVTTQSSAAGAINPSTIYAWNPTTAPAESVNGMYGKYNIFTGPYSSPKSPGGKTAIFVSQTTKLITPLGESGLIGVLLARANPQSLVSGNSTTTTSTYYMKLPDIYSTVHFRGMADVMTTTTSVRGTGANKHYALTPQITMDISNETSTANLLANYTLDSYYPGRTLPTSTTANLNITGLPGNQTDMNTYRTLSPSPMGRIYGIKYVTTGISALNTMGISTDANGFASSSGSSTNHLTFNYPSTFNSPDLNLSLNYDTGGLGSAYALYSRQPEARGDTAATQNNTRISQSVTVAFPK